MKKAFSLMELMIVIVILGLLAALVLPSLTSKGSEAKKKIACTNMKVLYGSVKNFKIDMGRYPTTEEGLGALIKNPDGENSSYAQGGYIEGGKLPQDPWGGEYVYLNNDDTIEIISLGSDKKEGGNDEASDIKLSSCK